MENLLLCSRALYDKDLLDKTREIEKLRKENKELWNEKMKLKVIMYDMITKIEMGELALANRAILYPAEFAAATLAFREMLGVTIEAAREEGWLEVIQPT